MPQVELGHAVLTEQPGHVVTPVGGDQRVIGLLADALEPRDPRGVALAEIGAPDLAAVEQAEHKALAGRIHQAHHPRAFPVGQGRGGNVGHRGQGHRIEHLDPAGLVVGDGNQASVLADRAADAVTALEDAFFKALAQQVDFGQAAVAAENVGVALVAGKHHRGVGQIAQAVDPRQLGHPAGFDDLHTGAGAFDHQAQVASPAQRRLGTGAEQQAQR